MQMKHLAHKGMWVVALIASMSSSATSWAAKGAASGANAPHAGAGGSFSAQAKRGEQKFATNCAMCHAPDLKGRDPAPALTGQKFMKKWEGKSLWDLYDKIRKTMPQQSKGSLSPRTYLDITAYVVQFNAINAGKVELRNDPKALKSVTIKAPDGKQEAAAASPPSM